MSTTKLSIDPSHSSVSFSIRHLIIAKVRGRFARFSGDVTLDEQDIARSSVNVSIEAASITTDEEKRDAHLRSADFFDVDKYPTLTFASRKVERAGKEALRVTGDLTIHGVTREVVLAVEELGSVKDPWGGMRMAFSAHTSIDRKDYGLLWNQILELGGVAVGEKVEIGLEVEAVKQASLSQAA